MPPLNQELRENDEILFCGTDRGRHLLEATLNNVYTLNYVMTGIELLKAIRSPGSAGLVEVPYALLVRRSTGPVPGC